MKVFAILTASLMTAGGAAYLIQDSSSICQHSCSYRAAKTDGGCSGNAEKPSCCSLPCPECATDCSDCCAVCEQCCAAGAQTAVSTKSALGASCCAAGDACCLAGAACCTVAEVPASENPAQFAAAATTASTSLK